MNWQDRTLLLAGDATVELWKKAHVLIIGLGGVGAYVAEQLVRAGIGTITIVDGDKLHETNLNRQLPALKSTIGKYKTEVLQERFMEINPELDCRVITEYVKDQLTVDILSREKYSYVVDAIDTLSPKIYLLYHCVSMRLPVISIMGTGGKWDPASFKVCDISQTYSCALADVLRKRLHKLGVYTGIQSVFSPEEVKASSVREEEGLNKKSVVGTVSYMPAVAACICASVVLREIAGEKIISELPIPNLVKKKILEQKKKESEAKLS